MQRIYLLGNLCHVVLPIGRAILFVRLAEAFELWGKLKHWYDCSESFHLAYANEHVHGALSAGFPSVFERCRVQVVGRKRFDLKTNWSAWIRPHRSVLESWLAKFSGPKDHQASSSSGSRCYSFLCPHHRRKYLRCQGLVSFIRPGPSCRWSRV